MMIDEMQLVVIVVAISAISFVVFSIVLLLRISRRTEEGSAEIRNFLNEIRADTQDFKLASSRLNTLIERSTSTVVGIEPRLDAVLKGFFNKVSGLLVSPRFVEFTQDGINVLQSVADTSAENLPKWQNENRAELNRLLSQKNWMEKELSELRARLDMSENVIASLRKQNHAADEAESAAAQLRTLNQRLVTEIRVVRKLLLESEQKYDPMIQELQIARARLAMQAKPDQNSSMGDEELAAGNAVLRDRVVELEALVKRFQARAQSSEEELSRTLREKSFIEERFLQSDIDTNTTPKLDPSPD